MVVPLLLGLLVVALLAEPDGRATRVCRSTWCVSLQLEYATKLRHGA